MATLHPCLTFNYSSLFLKISGIGRLLWNTGCLKISCHATEVIKKFLRIIPSDLPDELKLKGSHFTRNRKLPLQWLLTFILSMVASGKAKGVAIKINEFFTQAKRSGLWPEAKSLHPSSFTKARKKLQWEVLRHLLHKAATLAYECWPQNPRWKWKGLNVLAFDGSDIKLPATPQIRGEFDPSSGLGNDGKGHYPQCLMMTLYDVFRRFPIARSVARASAPERDQALALLPHVPEGSILVLDRGFPGYRFLHYLMYEHPVHFVARCQAKSSFKPLMRFIKSGLAEDVIELGPPVQLRNQFCRTLRLRVIRLESPNGQITALLTSLIDTQKYPAAEILSLYRKRWEIEIFYRSEKSEMNLETFHGKTSNAILQEIYASAIMAVIARVLMALSQEHEEPDFPEPQFKNALMVLASDAAALSASNPQRAIRVFNHILERISRIKYYRHKTQRPAYPRVNKSCRNKWKTGRQSRLAFS